MAIFEWKLLILNRITALRRFAEPFQNLSNHFKNSPIADSALPSCIESDRSSLQSVLRCTQGTSREPPRRPVRLHDPGLAGGGVGRIVCLTCVLGISVDSSAYLARTEPPDAWPLAAQFPTPCASAHSLPAAARSRPPNVASLAVPDQAALRSGAVAASTL